MVSFANTIRVWDKHYKREKFDERKCNEIYVYNIRALSPLAYTSPFSIKYVHQGSEYFKVNGVWHEVKAGQALIINSGSEVVCELRNKAEQNRGLSFFLHPLLITEVLNDFQTPGLLPVDGNTPSMLPLFYDGVLKEGHPLQWYLKQQFHRINTNPAQPVSELYYYEVACILLKQQIPFLKATAALQKKRSASRKEIVKRLWTAKEIMDSTLLEKFDLQTLSQKTALSRFHLVRSFKQVFGATPKQYFIRLKMEKAKELMKQHCIKEVAGILNYTDVFAFSKQFKITTKSSPAVYQKRFS